MIFIKIYTSVRTFNTYHHFILYSKLVRKSEGLSYFDGPTETSTVLQEDTDYLLPFTQNISSSGNQMLIRYYSEIEIARVYGFRLRFYCIPTASTIFIKILSPVPEPDEDCFTEDNTIPQPYRSWRIPGFGDRHFKRSEQKGDWKRRLPHADALKTSILRGRSSKKELRKSQISPGLDFM